MMGLSLTDPKKLPFEDRMKIKGGWHDKESIANIAKACHPEDTKERNRLVTALIDYCKSGDLAHYGDIKGWEWRISQFGCTPNPYPEVIGSPVGNANDPLLSAYDGRYKAAPADCLIHRDEFKRFLQSESINQWPATGFLANWWHESKPQGNEIVYDQRCKSFDRWLASQGVDAADKPAIKSFLDTFASVPDIFEALKKARQDDINTNTKGAGKDKPLWDISFELFNSKTFWQPYCKEITYRRGG